MLNEITDDLIRDLDRLHFGPPVAYVYNPLVYARSNWDAYCSRFGGTPREVLMMGMNPGPFGMAQVGVPFGEVTFARDWLGISGPVGRPAREHPKRPVLGFACTRSEVSGARVWGWARSRFGTPEAFFRRFYVTNYCPLVFMNEGGANVTPDNIAKSEREPLAAACNRGLRRQLDYFQPKFVIGIGKFAEARIREVVGDDPDVIVGCVPHPSPASPQANRDWAGQMDKALADVGVAVP